MSRIQLLKWSHLCLGVAFLIRVLLGFWRWSAVPLCLLYLLLRCSCRIWLHKVTVNTLSCQQPLNPGGACLLPWFCVLLLHPLTPMEELVLCAGLSSGALRMSCGVNLLDLRRKRMTCQKVFLYDSVPEGSSLHRKMFQGGWTLRCGLLSALWLWERMWVPAI